MSLITPRVPFGGFGIKRLSTLSFLVGALLFTTVLESAAAGLVVTFDRRGISSLSYNGTSLINLDGGVGDAFQIWDYMLGTSGGFGGSFASWDSANNVLVWSGNWGGSVTTKFSTSGDTLNVTMTIINPSAQTITGLNLYPLGLLFPQLPAGFGAPNYPQFHNNIDGPSLISADFGSGMVVLTNADAKILYLGYSPSGASNHYNLVAGSMNDTTFGFLASAVPVSRPIPPGGTDTYAFSLRFAPAGTDYHTLAGDVFTTFGQTWPQKLNWTDRRAIGELFMTAPTSSPIPDSSANPRNYSFTPNVNVQSPAGVTAFQQAAMAYATNAVQLLKSMNSQGAILWDMEGQQFPQDGGGGSVPNACGGTQGAISYVGSPDLLPQLSPEMNGVADAFFKTFTDAGLKCGMTIRPQQIVQSGANSYQNWCPVRSTATATSTLISKMQYAYNRWHCTLFYVDSDGGPDDSTSPLAWAAVAAAVPNALIFPENIWIGDHAYTAPLASFTAPYKPLHTPKDSLLTWPNSLTLTYVGDAPNGDLTNNPANPNQWNEFVQAVRGGDILSFRAWFDDEPLNNQVKLIYQQAGAGQAAPPNMMLTKSAKTSSGASLSTARPGDTVVFSIHYQNTSATSATGVVINDTIPTGVSVVSIANGGAQSSGAIKWTLGTVVGNASGDVSFTVTVN